MKHGYCDGIGEVKLTRDQYREYQELYYTNDCEEFCRAISEAREKDPSLNEREQTQIEEEEKELTRWNWYAAGIMLLVLIITFIIAFNSTGNQYNGMFAMLPMTPVIVAVWLWWDQMEKSLLEEKDPWLELTKYIGIAILAGLLVYISFIFILAIALLFKIPIKLFK